MVWKNKLKELIENKNLSYRKLAVHMGCDVKKVQKIEAKFNQEQMKEGKTDNANQKCNLDKLNKYKSKLVFVINNAFMSRSEVRQACKKEYSFLYRNDKEWLFKILPPNKQVNNLNRNKRVDWIKQDEELLLRLQAAYKELQSFLYAINLISCERSL